MRILLAALASSAILPAFANQAVLYERKNLRGHSTVVTRSTPNLGYMGFENRASSLYVMSGTWEFCTESYFQGRCRVFGPGEYRDLRDQRNRISSARLLEEVDAKPPGSGWGGAGAAEVEVFDRENFSSPLATLREATPNFERRGFNDAIASLVVRRGTWEFCTDAQFRGECVTYGPGRYGRLPGFDDKFSSARPVKGGWGGGGPSAGDGQRARIRLFEFGGFSGRSVWLDRDTPNFERLGFNDRAESMIVEGGRWRLCSDADGRGECREFRPGQYPVLPGELRNRVSSAFRR